MTNADAPETTPPLLESAGTLLLAQALGAAMKTEGWRGDIGPAVKAVTVELLHRNGEHSMADVVESLPCRLHVEGRE